MFSIRPCASIVRSVLELGHVAGLRRGELHHRARPGAVVQMRLQGHHHGHETRHRAFRSRSQRGDLVDPPGSFHHVDPFCRSERLERGHRRIADASLGHVDDASERNHVLRVQEQPEIPQHVLDLAALVEPHPAEHAVRSPDAHEHVLDHP